MMDILMNHRSIRNYKTAPVDEIMLRRILEAGTRASTTGNMQLYSIIVNKDESRKELLAPYHFNQPMVKKAPVLLTFCADVNRFHKWCEARKAEPAYDNFLWYLNAATDALLASQNVAVAAESEGLGICYLGTTLYMADKFIEALELPKGVIPVTAIVIGYPEDNPGLTDRLPLEAVVHHEKYEDYTPDMINELYKAKESSEQTRKLLEENQKETLAQVFTDNRYKKEDNLTFSKKYFEMLKKQGFIEF